jgi:FkbM family methyltransferase
MKIIKKHGKINAYLRAHPRLFDFSRRFSQRLGSKKQASYEFFKRLTEVTHDSVRFIQVGASDGLVNDPIRDLVVRNNWSGVFIEPLPRSYEKLLRNYDYLNHQNLFFENVAISTDGQRELRFWTYKESFLASLDNKEHIDRYRRKSSFERSHLIKFLPEERASEGNIEEIRVETTTIRNLMNKYAIEELQLLVIDAEGYDRNIVESTLADGILPQVIFFESTHITDKDLFYNHLENYGYAVREFRNDTAAVKQKFREILQ